MSQSDRWKKRDCVERYRAWADTTCLATTGSPLRPIQDETIIGLYAFFYIPIPASYSIPSSREFKARSGERK